MRRDSFSGKKESLEDHFKIYSKGSPKNSQGMKPDNNKSKPRAPQISHKKKVKIYREKKIKVDKNIHDPWILIFSIILAFTFFIPFSTVIGLLLGLSSYIKSTKKWPGAIAIVLNICLGFFNILWTTIFIDVFFFT